MSVDFRYLTIHVPNVWQTCEWYRMVFSFPSVINADATAARLDVPGQRLYFTAHAAQEQRLQPLLDHTQVTCQKRRGQLHGLEQGIAGGH